MSDASYVQVRGQRGTPEVADVFRDYWAAYTATHAVTAEEVAVAQAIMQCQTAALGGRVRECDQCGAVEVAYCSCRNRHCPKCQKFAKAQWVEQQKAWQLPVPYFHVIFTTDHVINAWVPANRVAIYNLLFQVVSATLKAFAAADYGGELGITAVLHTWSQVLLGHVHLHCIVTGGVLSFDGKRWVPCQPGYLFDIKAVSAAYRDRLCDGLVKLAATGQLVGVTLEEVQQVVAAMRAKDWEVFIKAFAAPDAVINYLSRYVHAVAIANYRLREVADGQVRFTYHDNQADGVEKELTLPAAEFIRRFLWHLLPAGFWRVRHYGLHQSAARKIRLPQARKALGLSPAVPKIPKLNLLRWLGEVVGEERLHRCHWCGARDSLVNRGEVGQLTWAWLWLKIIFGTLFGETLRGARTEPAAAAA